MMNWLYRNWAKLSIFLAIILTILIITLIKNNYLLFLIWIQIPIYLLHQFEEHFNEGFKNYINNKVFGVEKGEFPLNDQNIFWINIPIIWILMPLFGLLSINNLLFGLWIPFFALINSLSHVIFSLRNHEYNPGIIVSILLGIPISTYTIYIFYTYLKIPVFISLISILFAIIIHIIIFSYIRWNYNQNTIS
jgi:hypothetical protein